MIPCRKSLNGPLVRVAKPRRKPSPPLTTIEQSLPIRAHFASRHLQFDIVFFRQCFVSRSRLF
jgi:hypothetical protein